MDNEDQNARPGKQILGCLAVAGGLILVWLVIGFLVYLGMRVFNG